MTIKKFADIRKICSYLGKTLSLNLQKIQALTGYNTTSYRDIATEGSCNQARSNSFSFKHRGRDNAFYGCSEIIRTKNFAIFTKYATIFEQFTAPFHFF